MLEKLVGLEPLNLALIALVLVLAGGLVKMWKQFKKEREPSGADIVLALERSKAEMPRHWSRFLDQRIDARIDGHPGLTKAVIQLGELKEDFKELKTDSKETRKMTEQLYGRFFPNHIKE